jgi:hypothetical protein
MYIPKVVRHTLEAGLTVAAYLTAFYFLGGRLRGVMVVLVLGVAILLFPIVRLVIGIPIDIFDMWLRRKTRDPLWVMSHPDDDVAENDHG